MANRVESVLDSRRNIRIKENRGVAWRVNGGEIQGKGKIKDISTSGMMIEMQSDTLPLEGSVVSFDANLGHNNFVPQSGRLIWTNQKGKNNKHYQVVIHTTKSMQVAWIIYEKLGFKRSEDLDFMQGTLAVFGFRLLL